MICTEEEKTCFLERIRHLEVEKKYAYARMEEYKELIERFRWRFDKPKESGEYIVTIHGAAAATTLYYSAEHDEWQDDNQEVYRVDAWMPLPEPWEEDEIKTKLVEEEDD